MNKKIYPLINGTKILSKISFFEDQFIINSSDFEFQPSEYNTIKFNSALKSFKKLLLKNEDLLVKLATECSNTPIKYHQEDFNNILKFIENSLLKKTKESSSKITLRKKGRILLTLSANEPITITLVSVISALLQGNQVFVNPAKKNSYFVYEIINLLIESGFSKAINYLYIPKTELINYCNLFKFDAIFWFGSSKVIQKISSQIKHLNIEFIPEAEGNDLGYIGKDVNLDVLIPIVIKSLLTHNGQVCNALKGIFVNKDIFSKLISQLKNELKNITIGQSSNSKVDYCFSQTDFNEKQLDTYIKSVSSEKTEIFKLKNPFPLILINPEVNKSLLSKNLFNSTCWLYEVNSLNECLSLCKESPYGLGFTIFSKNKDEIKLAKNNIYTARLNINSDPLDVSPFEPWGGIKLSGIGGVSLWKKKFSNQIFIKKGELFEK